LHPDDIDILILSHAHIDHTGGLPAFLEARTTRAPLPVIAHPSILEPKRAARIMNIGLPDLDDNLRIKMHLKLSREPVSINPFLHTTGEISDRPHRDGTGWIMQHCVDDRWEQDPIMDDLSLVLETVDGPVLICGCCHAGLLNTMFHVRKTFEKDPTMVLGGTHMRSYPKEDMEHIAKILESTFRFPRLGLGHCTGRKQLAFLTERFGQAFVTPIYVGWSYRFEVQATIKPISVPRSSGLSN
jgi:7,8-dihydropterin-6-yl-methyl-4-(beta-D-ribofuranosyl)aminobenzene 5'-phosphate synthase